MVVGFDAGYFKFYNKVKVYSAAECVGVFGMPIDQVRLMGNVEYVKEEMWDGNIFKGVFIKPDPV